MASSVPMACTPRWRRRPASGPPQRRAQSTGRPPTWPARARPACASSRPRTRTVRRGQLVADADVTRLGERHTGQRRAEAFADRRAQASRRSSSRALQLALPGRADVCDAVDTRDRHHAGRGEGGTVVGSPGERPCLGLAHDGSEARLPVGQSHCRKPLRPAASSCFCDWLTTSAARCRQGRASVGRCRCCAAALGRENVSPRCAQVTPMLAVMPPPSLGPLGDRHLVDEAAEQLQHVGDGLYLLGRAGASCSVTRHPWCSGASCSASEMVSVGTPESVNFSHPGLRGRRQCCRSSRSCRRPGSRFPGS